MNPFGQLARERLLLLIRLEGYWGIGQERAMLCRNFKNCKEVYQYIWYQNSKCLWCLCKVPKSTSFPETKTPKLQLFSQAEETHAAIRKFMAEAVSEEVAEKAIVCLSFRGVFSGHRFFLKGKNGTIRTIVQPGDLERLWKIRKNNHPSSARKDIEWWIMINESVKWSMNLCNTLNVCRCPQSRSHAGEDPIWWQCDTG